MNGQEVTLSNGTKVAVIVKGGIKEITAYHKGEEIKVKKRVTTLKLIKPLKEDQKEEEAVVLAEATVSCSHIDQFSKADGRKEAWKALVLNDKDAQKILINRADRVLVVSVLNISDEPPKLKDKAAIKAAKIASKQGRLARLHQGG